MHLLQTFLFWTLNFDNSPFLSQLTMERGIYLKRKLCTIANECRFEIGRIAIIRACVIERMRPILYGAPCTVYPVSIDDMVKEKGFKGVAIKGTGKKTDCCREKNSTQYNLPTRFPMHEIPTDN